MNVNRFKVPSLPNDAGSHFFSNVEWWYFFSYLSGDKGGRYAVMGSFFRVGETELNKGSYLIYALIDLNKKTQQNHSFIDSTLKRNMMGIYLPGYLLLHPTDSVMWKLYKNLLIGNLPSPHTLIQEAVIKRHPARITFDDNEILFFGEKEDSFRVHLADKQAIIDLHSTPLKPIALIGGDGKPDKMCYYSFTRNHIAGQIRTARGIENVTGQGWFDHQWGFDYSLAKGFGWNWFGLQMDDGREILLNEETGNKTSQTFSSMANVIEKEGTLRFTRDVTFQKLASWKSLKTNTTYPIEWKITIPALSVELYVRAMFAKQEMPILGPLRAIWEGTCIVDGHEKLPGGKRKALSGKGFMELVGYS